MSVMQLKDFYKGDSAKSTNQAHLTMDATIVEGIKKLYDLGVNEVPIGQHSESSEIFSIPRLKDLIDQRL